MTRGTEFVGHGGRLAWGLMLAVLCGLGTTAALLANTADVRYQRDVTRMVFNDNLELLESVRETVGISDDSLSRVLATASGSPLDRPFIVVSIVDNRLWYKQGDSVLFTARVATGSGRTMVEEGGEHWTFDTPRGRLIVERKDVDPPWVPPDWHFVEQGRKRGLGIATLTRGSSIALSDGGMITVVGNDVVRRTPDGKTHPLEATEGREIVADGKIVIPPFGTNQRKYLGVLGTRRLYLGDGYGIHGTNDPASIGQSVSHGCVRMRNEDIEALSDMVPIGTPVFIY